MKWSHVLLLSLTCILVSSQRLQDKPPVEKQVIKVQQLLPGRRHVVEDCCCCEGTPGVRLEKGMLGRMEKGRGRWHGGRRVTNWGPWLEEWSRTRVVLERKTGNLHLGRAVESDSVMFQAGLTGVLPEYHQNSTLGGSTRQNCLVALNLWLLTDTKTVNQESAHLPFCQQPCFTSCFTLKDLCQLVLWLPLF